MKTYREIVEVMSMKDMKDLGGTAAQKKIAQDRQKAREAKNRGFDPKKPVLADKKKEEDEAPAGLDDLLKDIRSEPKAEKKRKPDLRKSQLGKWSQGVKNSPGKLAKKSGAIVKAQETKPAAPEVEKVKVKDDGNEGQRGNRPGSTKPKQEPKPEAGKGLVDKIKKEKEAEKKKNSLVGRVKDAIKNTNTGGSVGTSSSGDLEGLSGRDKGLIG